MVTGKRVGAEGSLGPGVSSAIDDGQPWGTADKRTG